MKRQVHFFALFLSLSFAAICLATSERASADSSPPRPNVILVMTDDQRPNVAALNIKSITSKPTADNPQFKNKEAWPDLVGKKSAAGNVAAKVANKPLPGPGINVLPIPAKIATKTKFLTPQFIFFQPKGVDSTSELPVMFYLHGISGRGNDIKPWAEQLKRRPWPNFAQLEKHKIIGIFPQCALGDTTKSIAGKKGDGAGNNTAT